MMLPHCMIEPPATTDRQAPRHLGGLGRALLLAAGVLCVVLAVLGVLLPLLPTTPFLLLAAACFARSSERLHRWLFANRLFGEYLRRYRDGEGMPRWTKVMVLAALWLALGASMLWVVPPRWWWLDLLLVGVGGAVSVHIARQRSRR